MIKLKLKSNFFFTNLIIKLSNFLMKKGFKTKILKHLFKTILLLLKKSGHSFSSLFFQLYINLNTYVEVKTINLKGNRTIITPILLNFKKRVFVISRWILKTLVHYSKIKLYLQLFHEFNLILNLIESSKAFLARNENFILVKNNRSNLHYRW